jgi:hypothetical protein
LVIVITTVAAFNMNMNQENDISLLMLANIEALAQNESGGYSCTISRDCGGGATVACTGVKECKHISVPLGSMSGRGVSCDGNITRCP